MFLLKEKEGFNIFFDLSWIIELGFFVLIFNEIFKFIYNRMIDCNEYLK